MSESQCLLCCTPGARLWFALDSGSIFRCVDTACGVGFFDPQPNDSELAALYEEYYYPDHGGDGVFENSTRFKSVQHYEALDDCLPSTERSLLDYGCGVGNFLEVASGRGAAVAGVEFDDIGRAEAAGRGFRVEKSIKEFEPDSFDIVYMNDVIEHLRDPVVDLREIHDCLRPGGALFVVTMNMSGLKPRIRGAKWDVVTNPTHLWFYDDTSLRATLNAAGFDRIEVQRWPVHFDHHGRARRILQSVLQRWGLDASLRMMAFRRED